MKCYKNITFTGTTGSLYKRLVQNNVNKDVKIQRSKIKKKMM